MRSPYEESAAAADHKYQYQYTAANNNNNYFEIRVQRAWIELYGAPNLYRLRLLVLISSFVWLGLLRVYS